jgi:hypothetical protein
MTKKVILKASKANETDVLLISHSTEGRKRRRREEKRQNSEEDGEI